MKVDMENVTAFSEKLKHLRIEAENIEKQINEMSDSEKKEFKNRTHLCIRTSERKEYYYDLIKELNLEINLIKKNENNFNSIIALTGFVCLVLFYVKDYLNFQASDMSAYGIFSILLAIVIYTSLKNLIQISNIEMRCYQYDNLIKDLNFKLSIKHIYENNIFSITAKEFYKIKDKSDSESEEEFYEEKNYINEKFYLEINKSCLSSIKFDR
jgi:hypothetical protein